MFQAMRYVYAVYQQCSFSRAARILFISQPSLSAAVKKEEERIGAPIFDRSTSPVQLTPVGREYIRCTERILEVETEFENYISDLENLKCGNISIGGTNFFISYVLPPLLSRFSSCYPAIRVQLVEGSTGALEEKLNAGTIDFLLDNSTLDPEIYDKKIIGEDHLLIAVPRSFASAQACRSSALTAGQIKSGCHLKSNIPSVSIKAFQEDPFLLLREWNDTRERAMHICKVNQFIPRIRLELDQQITAYNLACHGMGIAFVGDSLIQNLPESENVFFYKIGNQDSSRQIQLYYKRNRYLSKACSAFLTVLDQPDPIKQED